MSTATAPRTVERPDELAPPLTVADAGLNVDLIVQLVVKALHFQQIWTELDAARMKLGFPTRGSIGIAPGGIVYSDSLVTIRAGMR